MHPAWCLALPHLDPTEPRCRLVVLPGHRDDSFELQTWFHLDLARRPDHHRIGGGDQRLCEFGVEVDVDMAHPADPRFSQEGRESACRTVERLVREAVKNVGNERLRARLFTDVA